VWLSKSLGSIEAVDLPHRSPGELFEIPITRIPDEVRPALSKTIPAAGTTACNRITPILALVSVAA
jgi:hypothetical protein